MRIVNLKSLFDWMGKYQITYWGVNWQTLPSERREIPGDLAQMVLIFMDHGQHFA